MDASPPNGVVRVIAASRIDDCRRYHTPPSRHCRMDCRCQTRGGFMTKREAAGSDGSATTTAERRREVDAPCQQCGPMIPVAGLVVAGIHLLPPLLL